MVLLLSAHWKLAELQPFDNFLLHISNFQSEGSWDNTLGSLLEEENEV